MFLVMMSVFSVMCKVNITYTALIYNLTMTMLFMMFKCMSCFYYFSCDFSLWGGYYGTWMFILSAWITLMSLIYLGGTMNIVKSQVFIYTMMMIYLTMFFCFHVKCLINFYIWFELSLLPIFFMILGWGVQPERIQAGMYMIMYTLFGSLPLLACLINISYFKDNSVIMSYILGVDTDSLMLYMFMLFGFLMKLPLYGLHVWLPKAHVEAPVIGSMFLAGVLLKLGSYGVILISGKIFTQEFYWSFFLMGLSMMGSTLIGLVCLSEVDVKLIIAYSSVSHMGFMLAAILTCYSLGCNGGMLLMVAHGICSSGLFLLCNEYYEFTGTRSMLISRGFISIQPSTCLWWFILCAMNMGCPPSLSFMSELMMMMSIVSWSALSFFVLMIMCLLSGAFSIYLYSSMQLGQLVKETPMMPSSVKVMFTAFLHVSPLVVIMLLSSYMPFYMS